MALPIKLLFDENLAPRLAGDLADLFPGSAHVRDLGLAASDDASVRERAAAEGFLIVTKDDDFRQHSFLRGYPPKVVWIRLGNCRTREVAKLLRDRATEITAFAAEPIAALLVLSESR